MTKGAAVNSGRRSFLRRSAAAAAAAATLARPHAASAGEITPKKHIVTLSFDDGFRKSSIKTAEVYERFKLSACINVVATGHHESFRFPGYGKPPPRGDFGLWNDLRARGHEVMPHGYRHARKTEMSFADAKELILRCLDVFERELHDFKRKEAVFNFPYNASTRELEAWLPTEVRAFRTFGEAVNRWPKKGETRLTCDSFGPGNCEAALERQLQKLLALESGWLIFNAHGLDDEGWGPMRATFLERFLERLLAIESVEILPAGRVLAKHAM